MKHLALLLCLAAAAILLPAQTRTLDIYWIDVEGGASTLIVAPSGESLLVDTGFPGNDDRDAKRIQAAAMAAGLTRIDNLVITHFHVDHVGGAPGAVQANADRQDLGSRRIDRSIATEWRDVCGRTISRRRGTSAPW